MDLPRDEMAFRKDYEKYLLERTITTVFRPGIRVYPNRRGYIPGETVTARVIEQCGSDELGVPPLFNDTRIPIRISCLTVKAIDDIEREDFEGSSPDVFDRESLEEHLIGIYQKPIECFDGAVTRIQFRYVGSTNWNCRRKPPYPQDQLERKWSQYHGSSATDDETVPRALSLARRRPRRQNCEAAARRPRP